jgi:hypothetical protein
MAAWPAVTLTAATAARVRDGVAPAVSGIASIERAIGSDERVRLLGVDGELLALAETLRALDDEEIGDAADDGDAAIPGESRVFRFLRVMAGDAQP